jgi:hypothetical protein
MMRYVKAFLIKLLRLTFNFFLFMGLVYNEPFSHIFLFIFVIGTVTFLFGDLIVLRKFGSTIGIMLDALLAFGGLWGLHVLLGVSITYGHLFLFTLITFALCAEEFIYHIYVERNVFGIDRPSLMDMINKL